MQVLEFPLNVALAAGLTAMLLVGPAVGQTASRSVVTQAAVPRPQTLLVDRQAVFQNSKVGQDIERQLNAFRQNVQTEFGGAGRTLQKEQQAMEQLLPTLPADVRKKKADDLQARIAAFREKVQARQGMLQAGDMNARQLIEQALAGILKDIMRERGANLVVEKSSVVVSDAGIDVTTEALGRLDRKLSKFKVNFAAPSDSIQMH